MTTIAFDGVCYGDGPMTGVARAFDTTLRAYAEASDHDCVLLVPDGVRIDPPTGMRCVAAPTGPLARQRRLPRLLAELGADVLHSSVAAVPLRAPCPTIATVHDLPWRHPELAERSGWWRRFATARSLRSASLVLTPSTMTADDVNRWQRELRARVRVVPHGTVRGELPDDARTDARNGPLLVLGDDRPRKNRERLRAAHLVARAQDPSLPELEFVGPPDRYVDEADKLAKLRTCRALVHVSLFEGFGLPVLEGLAHGAPVLCSDLPPHLEIAADCAVAVDPRSTEAIADGLLRIHRETGLRHRLVRTGYARAASFPPAAAATGWRRAHDEVLR